MGIEVGILGLLVLVLDVWAILKVVGSGQPAGTKALWIVLILVLPVVGLIAWLLAGPR